MQILKETAAKNAYRGLAPDKPAFQNKVASIRPDNEKIKGFAKYCIGMARRYLSRPMLATIASSSPARPLMAIQTISAPRAAKINARTKEKARKTLEMVVF